MTVTLTDAPIERDAASTQREVVGRLAEPGLDLGAARAVFDARRGRRRRTRRGLGASAAALVLIVGATAFVLSRDTEPDAVLADRDEEVAATSSTTTVSQAAIDQIQVVADTVPVSTTVAPPPTAPAPTMTEAVPDTAPPVTHAPNQALQATLTVATPTVEAGGTATVVVSWADTDLGVGAATPRHTVSWGDPLVSTPVDATPRAACDTPGAPASGSDPLRFRYSTPGRYTVRVVLDTCGGQGAYADRVELTGLIEVTNPSYVDSAPGSLPAAGRSVVVFQPPLADGTPWPPLDQASAVYVPSDPAQTPVPLRLGEAVSVFTASGPATVLVLPAAASGTIRLSWSDPALCAVTSGPELSGVDGAVLSLPLAQTIC